MGLMDTLTGLLKSSGMQDNVSKTIGSMMQDGSFSLEKFKARADQAGTGHIVDSWIGKGENEPITAEQVKQTADPANLQRIADESGVSVDEAATQISKALPDVVDKLTPEGTIPSGATAQSGIGAS